MGYIAANNARTKLGASLGGTLADTAVTINAMDVAKFPAVNHLNLTPSEYSYLTLQDSAGNVEHMKIIRHDSASATITVVRGAAAGITGTTDASVRAWAIGDGVVMSLNAQVVNDAFVSAIQAGVSAASSAASASAATAIANAATDVATAASNAVTAHMAATNAAHAAAAIGFTPTGAIAATTVQAALAELDSEKAPLDSPAFANTPTAPTPDAGDATTKLATMAAVDRLRDVPPNAQTVDYTLALTDRGKSIDHTGNVTVPANATVAFPVGSVVVLCNLGAGSKTLTQAAGVTLVMAGTTNTGNRTLARYAMVTLRKVATDTWLVSGAGLS